MQRWIRCAVAVVLMLFALQNVTALQLPWEKTDSGSAPAGEPRPTVKVPASESDMFPKMKANYVGGKTLTLDAITVDVPAGWYRGEKKWEDDEEAYLFACIPDGEEPVCMLRIEYDLNEMVMGAEQVPEFLKLSRQYLEKDGEWSYEEASIGGRGVPCLRSTDPGDETLLLLQYSLVKYVPSIYVLMPGGREPLAPEAAEFVRGIKLK